MKKLFSLITALLLLGSFTVVRATTTRIYCKMEYSWWTKDGARIGIILDSGSASAMTLVSGSGNTWYSDVDLAGHTTVKFRRIGSSNTDNWGAETTAQNISSNNVGTTNNFFTITNSSDTWSGNSQYCNGTWGTYVYTPPTIILKGGFNGWGDSDVFTDNGSTATFTKTISAGSYGFKITVGGDWRSKNTTIARANSGTEYDYSANENDATLSADITGDYTFTYTYSTQKLSVTFPDEPVVVPSYTFPAGTTIYYDFTGYGAGVNVYNSDWDNLWKDATAVASVFSKTLSSAWEVTASTVLFRSNASGWNNVSCSTLPTEGQNMLVSTNGSTCHWDTYVPPVDPTVDFVSLGSTIGVGLTAKFAATSTNVDNPVYTFYVKKGSAAYSSAVTSYNFAETGNYTVKVEVNGDNSKHAENTQEVTVINGNNVYYVKTNAWEQVNAHMWGADPGTSWPGELMTLTDSETEKHQYPVYVVSFTPNYSSIIFSNNGLNQSSNLGITYATPYYYDGAWYTTLADCDPLSVTLSGLEDNYLVGATSATISASSDLTNATYTYQLKIDDGEFAALSSNPYTFAAAGTYTFKVTATGDEGSKSATKEVTVSEPLTLYFVNKDAWTNVNIYFYNPSKTDWPGDAMTATGDHTEGHNYAVYSYTVPASTYGSANVIFNNGSGTQTSDLSVNANHYFFDNEWYATLAEIDPATYVEFDGVAATILVNTPLTLAATSNVTDPGYRYYAKPVGGDYAAITSPHTFTAVGAYTLKVEALENNTGDPVAYREKEIEVYTTHTFTNGSKIYVDFSAVSGDSKGVNYPKAGEADLDYDASGAGSVKTITFSADVEWSTLNDFIKTQKAGYAGLKFTVPAEGENCAVVAADGASYTWTTRMPSITIHSNLTNPSWETSSEFVVAGNKETASLTMNINQGDSYELGINVDGTWRANGSAFDRFNASYAIPAGNTGNCTFVADATGEYTFTWTYETNTLSVVYPEALSVALTGLNATQFVGDEVTVGATSNLTNVSYAYELKIGEGEYATLAANPYTFAAAGVYIFKVTATGDEGQVSATKEVTVNEPLTLYFVNKEGWSNIYAYAFATGEVKNHNWPGELMTATGESTARNSYAVYSILIAADTYTTAIFNNGNGGDGNQTGDMTIVPAKPYYYDGEWYATLAECDQPDLTTNFYWAGSLNSWSTTDNRFMKATEEATTASVTFNITEYSNIEFKVMEGNAYCGSSDAITKDDNTATIAEAGHGDNIAMTPYAAGDYVFTLNLSTRELTVTYPDGDPMPIPTNIFLAGTMNSWAPDNADYKFTVSGDVASLALTLDEMSEYQFKLVYNGSWYGANYNFNYYWNTDVELVHEGDASHLFTFKAGTYTFEYNTSTGKLSVRFQATSATSIAVSSYEYATLYSATAFDVPNEVEAYIITGIDGIHLTKERIYRIPAETGVILHAPEGSYDFYEGDSRYMGVDVSSNMLKGTTADQDIENELVHYVLSYDTDDNVGLFWPYGTGANQGVGLFNNKAGKAYLEIPAQAQSQGVIARRGFPFFPVADMPTGIESQELKVESGKMILNGQLLIIRDGRIFNAQGARVK